MVMESRKAAPALRARLLRSYVPLRRDPSESVLSGTIPGLPGGSSLHPQIQIQQIKTKTELFRLRLTVYPVSAFEAGKYTCFQTAAQNTVLCQPIKFCLRFFLFEFEIVGGKRSREGMRG